MLSTRLRWIGLTLLGSLLLALVTACGGQANTSTTGAASGGVNPVPTVGTGGSASGAAVGGAGNPTRGPAPVPGASPSSAAAQTINVSLTSANQFQPATVDVPRGATVVWTNTSQTTHTVTDDPAKAPPNAGAALPQGAQSWDSGPLGPGATFSHIFDTPGQYTYFCSIHGGSGMLARVTVSS